MAEIKKAGISEGGHQMTGKVAILYGTVKAISPDGTVRLLKVNSPVFADDRIITGDDGSISIVFDTFPPTQLDLGRVSDVVLMKMYTEMFHRMWLRRPLRSRNPFRKHYWPEISRWS